jgi:hypothetical protein
MNTSTTRTWEAFVRSDVYAGQVNEDGERPDELRYYVVCEDQRGFRFRSEKSFTTEALGRAAAEGSAESFCETVARYLATGSDPSKSEKWFAIQGCYGSAAYSNRLELELDARDLDMEAGHDEGDRFRRAVGLGY